MGKRKLTLKEAAIKILHDSGEPLHYQEMTKRVLDQELIDSGSKTPDASLNAVLAVDIKRHGSSSIFTRVKPGVFGLREKDTPPPQAGEIDESERRVRVPYYPTYSHMRLLIPLWIGVSRSTITGMRSTISSLWGTPQKPLAWTNPDEWIPERLEGEQRALAEDIWKKSHSRINPRHILGHWYLVTNHGLLEDGPDGLLKLTAEGKDFLESPGGDAESRIDEVEGLLKLLAIVAESGPGRFGEFVGPWGDYLQRRSKYGTDSTIKETLRSRLKNLLDRGLITRSSQLYTISETGLAYLDRTGNEDAPGSSDNIEIWALARKQEAVVRESIQELLLDMDPIAFEHLIKQLLESMDYNNVSVTSPSNDGGVDVLADIELGITSVREVVQAKRHKRAIQRKDLDALRGSLHRFAAVRGTIITTSRFTKGTQDAAFELGAAPITLIDGQKLINLLIEHEIGVRKKAVEVLELNPDAFAGLGADESEEADTEE